ncbi:hypothetical protein EYC84_004498 [Monilinia fructicola]|uniref:Xylulose 5-phosphate/Fructose 6-phosphate phosphoketolase C-terminal domain-containing protein n=1 Tax=Monilinia fructicola TaxID=38448 RepID=A0A5M9K8X5_MONFR|nr:hypothetical protein EYC84_004498 [Monilinia fructicola]
MWLIYSSSSITVIIHTVSQTETGNQSLHPISPSSSISTPTHGSSTVLTYKRPGQANIHVRGYNEKGNIDTPLELAIRNQTDRYSLAIDAIDRVARLGNTAAGVREKLLNMQIKARSDAFEKWN